MSAAQKRSDSNSVNAELVIMTYGAIVIQLIKDYQDIAQVNSELDKM